MDNYTELTKNWLEERYSQVDENGVYIAHQPIYGFRKGKSDPALLGRYLITYQIIKALSRIKFSSLLDIGGAEGYKAALIKDMFGVEVLSSDLSEEACKRAEEIFNIKSIQGDIHNLDFKDEEFDVVLCSETLEHVSNLQEATFELLRIAKNAVVITVPHESEKVVNNNIQRKIPHSHIHSFNENSFDFVNEKNYKVISYKFYHKYLKIVSLLIDGIPRKGLKNMPYWVTKLYNLLMNVTKYIAGKKTFERVIDLDDLITNYNTRYYNGLCFVIVKKEGIILEEKKISDITSRILNFNVPFFYLSEGIND